ncbi:secondary carrier transporter [Lithospermum erythrorhizon]|uniref:Secondary carrier transporter n=1 Tax=Lithospermum erythrorhizon TaxID=34254 RepID=A0AAV3P8S5_LITER
MGGLSAGFTLDEATSSIGFGYFHVIAVFFAGLGWASSAMGMTLLSVIGPPIKSEWGLSSSEESMLTSVVFSGTILGAYVWGYISDAYGRRMSCIGSMICIGGALFFVALSPGYVYLLPLLCLFGFGTGGVHVFASWFLEFAPTSSRGSWTAAISLFYSVGNILAASLAWVIMPRLGWRWLTVSSCLTPLSVLFIGCFIPESPRYLCMKGKTSEAYKILEEVALFNKTRVPPGVLIFSPLIQKDEEHSSSEKGPLLSSIGKNSGNSRSPFSSVLVLFSPTLLRTTLLIWILCFANVFIYYGIILLTSELSVGQNRCGPGLNVQENNQQDATSYGNIFVNSLAEMPSAFIAVAIVDRLGRKLSIVVTSTLSFFLFLPLVWRQSDITTTVLLFGTRLFFAADMTILSVYGSEVYPTSVRSTGSGIAGSIGNSGGVVCPLVAIVLVEGCHQGAAIFLYEVVILLMIVSVLLIPVETSGKELRDVLPSDEE